MKIGILPLFLFIYGIPSVSAQPYQSIFASGDGETEWVFKWSNIWGNTNDTAYIEKDTTVNGITYKKVITRSGMSVYGGGLLREDINTGYVWYRDLQPTGDPLDTVERIAFRFDLNVGDTFDISNRERQPGSYPITDNIVDSVKIVNGLKHIYFRGQFNSLEPFTIVEGVGSNMGILWKHYQSNMLAQYLLCSYKSGQKTAYVNRFYNGVCNVGTGIDIVEDAGDGIMFYPQPSRKTISIQNKTTHQIARAVIVNQAGTVIKELSDVNITTIDVGDIPAGSYFLKLYTSSDYLSSKPIIITR